MQHLAFIYLAGYILFMVPSVWAWCLDLKKRREAAAKVNAEAPGAYTAAPDWGRLASRAFAGLGWFMMGPIFAWGELDKERETPVKKPRVIPFPKEHVRKLLELSDAFSRAPEGRDRAERYDLWSFIEQHIPEVAEEGAHWRIDFKSATGPKLVELPKKEK